MLARFLAIALSSVAPDMPPTAPPPVAADAATALERLQAELPKPANYATLLNSADLADAMDYPKESIAKEEEGTVRTWLLVGTDGRVERCGIETSSGSPALDAQTCKILLTNARFHPAQDAQGKPVRSIYHQPLTWKLEDAPDPALMANADEIRQLGRQLPKARQKSKLLNATSIASAMDYPHEALRKAQTGTTRLLLLVGADGRVERCAVEASSGSEALDAQSCNLFIANAEFQPARDRRGRAIQSIYHQQLTWKLQDGPNVELKDWISRMSLIVGPENQVRNCKPEIFYNGQWMEVPKQVCDKFLETGTGILAVAKKQSKLHDSLIIIENWVVTTPGLVIPELGRRAGETLVVLRSATASYGADGKRTHCTKGESFGLPEFLPDICAFGTPGAVAAVNPQPNGKPIENLRTVSAMFLMDEPNQPAASPLTPR